MELNRFQLNLHGKFILKSHNLPQFPTWAFHPKCHEETNIIWLLRINDSWFLIVPLGVAQINVFINLKIESVLKLKFQDMHQLSSIRFWFSESMDGLRWTPSLSWIQILQVSLKFQCHGHLQSPIKMFDLPRDTCILFTTQVTTLIFFHTVIENLNFYGKKNIITKKLKLWK